MAGLLSSIANFLRRQQEQSNQLRSPEHFGRESRAPDSPMGTLRSAGGTPVGTVTKTTVKTTYGPGDKEHAIASNPRQHEESSVSVTPPPGMGGSTAMGMGRASPSALDQSNPVETVPFNPASLEGDPLAGPTGPAQSAGMGGETAQPMMPGAGYSTGSGSAHSIDGEIPEIQLPPIVVEAEATPGPGEVGPQFRVKAGARERALQQMRSELLRRLAGEGR